MACAIAAAAAAAPPAAAVLPMTGIIILRPSATRSRVGGANHRTAAAAARIPDVSEYFRFLRAHPVWWLAPIALYLGTLLWLATRLVRTPENPFAYTLY